MPFWEPSRRRRKAQNSNAAMRQTFLVLLSLVALSAHAQSGDDWKYSIEPYLLGASIDGDATLGRATGVPVDVSTDQLLENLESAFMLNFEARFDNGWGFVLDYGFMDLGADTTVGFGGVVSASVRQAILEAIATRRLDVAAGRLELFGGVRWWDNEVKASLDPSVGNGSLSTEISEDWVDPIVGLRWTRGLSDRWEIRLRGDVGGFGVGSDFTWGANAALYFRMSERMFLDLGYRALYVDYANDKASNEGAFAYDTTTHGPILGFAVRW